MKYVVYSSPVISVKVYFSMVTLGSEIFVVRDISITCLSVMLFRSININHLGAVCNTINVTIL